MVSLLIIASFPMTIWAHEHVDLGKYQAKDEVIYGKLDHYGQPESMYVVNSFNITDEGYFIDYGNYIDVRNLTDLSTIKQTENNEIHFEAEDDFYYQGELKEPSLPWNIEIIYVLDGEEIHPDQLAGSSGKLEIQIETSAHEAIDPIFFDYYLLQISVTLDPLHFSNIQAPKGTAAKEGKNNVISFNVMPGEEEEIILSALVTDVEMDPIEIVAIPANLAIDDLDTDELKSEMEKLVDAIADIHSGVSQLSDGASALNNGASTLSDGSNEYKQGIDTLNRSSEPLVNGSAEILQVFKQMGKAMEDGFDIPNVEELEQLPEQMRNIAHTLKDFSSTLDEVKDAIKEIPDDILTDDDIKEMYEELEVAGVDEQVIEIIKQLEITYEISQMIKELQDQIPDAFFKLIEDNSVTIDMIADGLEEALKNIDKLDDLEDLQVGLVTLSSEYEAFHHGLMEYTEGVDSLATSYGSLNEGTKEIFHGTGELNDGINQLEEGTEKLRDETADLPDEMQSEIEAFMEDFDFSGFEPTSFVSSQNEQMGVTQFVLQTKRIEIDEEEEDIEEEQEEKKGFWSRFFDLFK